MTLYIQDQETENVIFHTDDCFCVPNVGESLMIENIWYTVVDRVFSFKHLSVIDSNSVSIFVKQYES